MIFKKIIKFLANDKIHILRKNTTSLKINEIIIIIRIKLEKSQFIKINKYKLYVIDSTQ